MNMIETCRVCLCDARRMHAIRNTLLQEMWEKLTNTKFNTDDGKPCLVCYICCAQLRKCIQLRKRALKAEELLTAFINNGLEQSQETLSLPASLTNGLDSMCFNKELYQFEYKQFETNSVEEIKTEYEEGSEENDQEENYIHLKQEADSSDTYQEEYLDFDEFESDTVLDDPLLTSTILNNILQGKEPAARKRKLNEVPQKAKRIKLDETAENKKISANTVLKGLRNNNCKASVTSSSKNLSVYTNVEIVKSEPDIIPRVNCSLNNDNVQPNKVILQNNKALTRKVCYDVAENEVFKRCRPKSTDAKSRSTSTGRSDRRNKSNVWTKKTQKNVYSCPTCQYKCVTKRELKKHIGEHAGKKYLCQLCDYRSTHKGHLNIHIMNKHTKVKNFSCHICQYTCVTNSRLNVHLRKHTGEKPYICHLCDYRCSVKGLLRRHMQYKHTKEKKFSCHICEYKCVVKEYLNVHLRKHTGEQPYSCDLCDYKCSQKSNLGSHIKNKHTKEMNL